MRHLRPVAVLASLTIALLALQGSPAGSAPASAPSSQPYSFALSVGGATPVALSLASWSQDHEIIEEKETDANGNPIIVKVPGGLRWADLTVARELSTDMRLWQWRQQVENGGADAARTDVVLTVFDARGTQVATYNFTQAWPSKYAVGQNNGVTRETLVLVHEGNRRRNETRWRRLS